MKVYIRSNSHYTVCSYTVWFVLNSEVFIDMLTVIILSVVMLSAVAVCHLRLMSRVSLAFWLSLCLALLCWVSLRSMSWHLIFTLNVLEENTRKMSKEDCLKGKRLNTTGHHFLVWWQRTSRHLTKCHYLSSQRCHNKSACRFGFPRDILWTFNAKNEVYRPFYISLVYSRKKSKICAMRSSRRAVWWYSV